MQVMTTKGPLELDALRVVDVAEVTENARKVATEYYQGDELVRRDVAVSMLMPLSMTGTPGEMS